jgi:hypothetical protein
VRGWIWIDDATRSAPFIMDCTTTSRPLISPSPATPPLAPVTLV